MRLRYRILYFALILQLLRVFTAGKGRDAIVQVGSRISWMATAFYDVSTF